MCLLSYSVSDARSTRQREGTNLARACHAQCCQQRVGAISAMGREHALDEPGDVGAVEHVELGGIFLKDLCEGEFLDGAAAIVWRIESDVFWGGLVVLGLFDGEKALALCSLSRPQSEVDLEEVVRLLRSHNRVAVHCAMAMQASKRKSDVAKSTGIYR